MSSGDTHKGAATGELEMIGISNKRAKQRCGGKKRVAKEADWMRHRDIRSGVSRLKVVRFKGEGDQLHSQYHETA